MTNVVLGPFRLDTRNDLLLHGTEPVALGKRAVALLRALVERPGELVSKDTLIEAVWSGQIVEENNLTIQIAALRRVLGTAPDGGRWIETLPRRGYRFVGPVITAAPVRVDPPKDASPISRVQAERRQITVLACELVGAAAEAGMDLDDLREAVRNFRRCVSEKAGRHGGFVYSQVGNSVLVLFGYPAAHEHDAEQAVRAGLERCAAGGASSPDADPPMRCRAGIATGVVIIGSPAEVEALRGQGIVGDVPAVGVRLLA